MKQRNTKRFLAMILAVAMILQQSSIGTLAAETEAQTVATEAVTEAQPAAIADTEPETAAASETQAAATEAAATETVETAAEAVTEAAADNTEIGTEAVSETTADDTEKATEAVTEAVTEKVTETAAQTDTEEVTEAVTETAAETDTEEATEAVESEAVSESETEAETETETEAGVMAINEATPMPIAEKDTREGSTNLNDFVIEAKVEGDEHDESGNLVLRPGKKYSVYLKFSEESKAKSFSKDGNAVLTFDWPQQLTPVSPEGTTFSMKLTVDNQEYTFDQNHFTFENNQLKVTFDPEMLEKLQQVNNAWFEVSLQATLSEGETDNSIDWHTGTDQNVTITQDAKVDVVKDGTYDPENGCFNYTVTVTSTGNAKNVVVTDQLGANSLLTLNQTSIEVESTLNESLSWDSITTKSVSSTGFSATIPEMKDGETVTFKYSANIDYSKVPAGSEVFTKEGTINEVTVEPDNGNTETKSKDFENTTVYNVNPTKEGKLIGDVKDGKQIVEWTITLNEERLASIGGSTITDTLQQKDNAPMKYCGTGITVTKYAKDGTQVGPTTVQWNSLTNYDQEKGWTYKLDDDTVPYKYVITYQTEVDVTDAVGGDVQLENKLTTDKWGETTGKATLPSQGDFDVHKNHGTVSNDAVNWTVEVTIPASGFDESFVITDVLPHIYANNHHIYDDYVEGSLAIEIEKETNNVVSADMVPISETDYTVDTSEEGKVVITFTESKLASLFPKTDRPRKMVLTYQTKPDPEFTQAEHANTVTVVADGNTKPATDRYSLVEKSMEKLAEIDQKAEDGLPVYKYYIKMQNVTSSPIEINDTFPEQLVYYVKTIADGTDEYNTYNSLPYIAGSDDIYKFNNKEFQTAEAKKLLDASSYQNGKFTVEVPKKADGTFYAYYWIKYYLKVKDADALREIKQMAANEGGTATLTNTATWEGITKSADVTYTIDPLSKSVAANGAPNKDNHYIATYEVDINPDKLKLNDGKDITVTDELLTNMKLVPDTLEITVNGVKQNLPYYPLPGDHGFTLTIPDESAVHLVYKVKIIGSGQQNYSNSISLSGKYEKNTDTQNVQISSGGQGGGYTTQLHLFKYGDNPSIPLANAKFRLHDVTNKSKNPIDVTTDDQGKATLQGLIVGHEYELEEIEAPDGYVKLKEPIRFKFVGTVEGDGQYAHDDTIGIGNEKVQGGGLTVTKTVTGNAGETDRDFHFTVTLSDTTITGDYGDMTFANGVASFTLKNGDSRTADNLPEGIGYTVTETDANTDGYTTTVAGSTGVIVAGTTASGTIATGSTAEVTFTNDKKNGSLKIVKSVEISAGADSTNIPNEFKFTVKDAAGKTYNEDGEQVDGATVTVKVGEDKTIPDLPLGTYTVEEVGGDVSGFTLSVEVTGTTADGKITVTEGGTATATFTNTYTKFNDVSLVLKGTKMLEGGTLESGAYSFHIALKEGDATKVTLPADTKNGADGIFKFDQITFSAAGTYKFYVTEVSGSDKQKEAVEYDGAQYEVTVKVTAGTAGYTIEVTGASVTSDGSYELPKKAAETASFVNRVKKGSLILKKVVAGDGATEAANKTFQFTVKGPDGKYYDLDGTASDEAIQIPVTPGSDATLENLPVGEYTVTETSGELDGYIWTTEVDGKEQKTVTAEVPDKNSVSVEFTNTYTKLEDADLVLRGTKMLEGGTLKSGTYSFQIAQKNDDETKVTIPGNATNDENGIFTFGKITFSEAGTYTFYVTEVLGNDEQHVDYDSATYTITVEVSADTAGFKIDSVNDSVGGELTRAADGAYELPKQKAADKVTDTASFVNRVKKGSLIIKKTVEAPKGVTAPATYQFTIKGSDGKWYDKDGNPHDTQVTVTVDMSEKGQLEVKNLPVGSYTVTETSGALTGYTWTTTVKVDGTAQNGQKDKTATAEVPDEDSVTVEFTNTYTQEKGSLILRKVVTGDGAAEAAEGKSFQFTVQGPDGKYYNTNGTTSDTAIQIPVTPGKDVTLNNLPTGSYTVTEVGDANIQNYTLDVTTNQTVSVEVTNNKSTVAEITNKYTRKVGGLTVTKKVEGTGANPDQAFQFTVTLDDETISGTYDGMTFVDGAAEFSLKAGETKTATGLPVGVKYTVTEDDYTELGYTTTEPGNAEGTIAETGTTVEFVNTYKAAQTSIQLKAVKTYNRELTDGLFTFNLVEITSETDETPLGYEDTATNKGTDVAFKEITYTEAGTHYYKITEENGGQRIDGITYSDKSYIVTVTVKDDGKGKLTVEADPAKPEDLTFENTYAPDEVKVTLGAYKSFDRTLVGGEFSFKLTELGADGKPAEDAYTDTTSNDKDGNVTFKEITYKEAGEHVYQITEVIPDQKDPTIIYSEAVYTVKVSVKDVDAKLVATVDPQDAKTLVFENKSTTVKIDKVDENGNKLAGAKLQVTVKDAATGEPVESWTTGDQTHDITGKLEIGKTYVLEETEAPTGYAVSAPIEFAVDKDGNITVGGEKVTGNLLTMTDAKLKLKIDKVATGTGEELDGAKMELYDSENNKVDEWTSKKGERHDFGSKLKAGETYTLKETTAPDGYGCVTDITIEVGKDGTIATSMTSKDENGDIVYLVEDAPLKFNVNKVETGTGEEVDGATLELLDKDGNVIDKWESKKGQTHDFGSKMKVGETYTLRESITPDGYLVATDITISIDKNGNITSSVQASKDAAGNDVYLVEDDLKPATHKGSISVTKSVTDILGNQVGVDSATFYVALFADAARTKRISEPKAITFGRTSEFATTTTSSTAVFENLGKGTYYVSEVDESGNPIAGGTYEGASFTADFGGGAEYGEVILATDTFAGQLHFDNIFVELPPGFFYEGELQITKKVMKRTVKGSEEKTDDYEVSDTFYAGVFLDEDYTDLYGVAPIVVEGASSSTVTISLPVSENPDDPVTYYITETDENGNPYENGADLGFAFDVDGSNTGKAVEVYSGSTVNSVTITNTYTEEIETESESEKQTETEKTKAAQTGDDTNYWLYLMLLMMSAGAAATAYTQRRRDRKNSGK